MEHENWALNAELHRQREMNDGLRHRISGLQRANSIMQWVLAASLLMNIAVLAGAQLLLD